VKVKDIAPREGPLTVETEEGATALSHDVAAIVRVTPNLSRESALEGYSVSQERR